MGEVDLTTVISAIDPDEPVLGPRPGQGTGPRETWAIRDLGINADFGPCRVKLDKIELKNGVPAVSPGDSELRSGPRGGSTKGGTVRDLHVGTDFGPQLVEPGKIDCERATAVVIPGDSISGAGPNQSGTQGESRVFRNPRPGE